MHGEGHFTALLQKDGESFGHAREIGEKGMKALPEEFTQFLKDSGVKLSFDPSRMVLQGDHISYLPENMRPLGKLRRMRTGWYLGDIKKKRFEPSGFFARGLSPEECDHWIDLELDDPRVIKYLKCETLDVPTDLKNGWYIVGVCGHSLGWGKVSQGTLKNKYPSGWRWM